MRVKLQDAYVSFANSIEYCMCLTGMESKIPSLKCE